jgi:hypothetical protein
MGAVLQVPGMAQNNLPAGVSVSPRKGNFQLMSRSNEKAKIEYINSEFG